MRELGNGVAGISHIDRLSLDAADLRKKVERFLDLPLTQLQWKPTPTSWSILECLEHVSLTADAYHPVIESAFDRAETVSEEVSFRPALLARLFIKAVSPDPRLKVKTLASVTPDVSELDTGTIARFLRQWSELEALLDRAKRIDFNRTKITSPLNRFLRLSIGEALTVLVRHGERHVQQAERVQSHDGFRDAIV